MIEVWRDTPKLGETDAKWCAYRSENGHVVEVKGGFETPTDAYNSVVEKEHQDAHADGFRTTWRID